MDALWRLRKTLQAGLREERRRELAERTVRELVELMSPRTAGQGEVKRSRLSLIGSFDEWSILRVVNS